MHILHGRWALGDILISNKCFCTNTNGHTWRCLARFNDKTVRVSPHEIHTFVCAHRTALLSRPNLIEELILVSRTAVANAMWIYAFYPLIQDLPEFQKAINHAANNPATQDYGKALMGYGVVRNMPYDGIYTEDQRLYFDMIKIGNEGRSITTSFQFGPYSSKFIKAIQRVGEENNLSAELILLIFNMVYRTRVSSNHFHDALAR